MFEKELFDIAKNIAFHDTKSYGKFQNELKNDLAKMKKCKK